MRPHGEFTVALSTNVIETTLAGSFNEQGTLLYITAVKEKVAELKGKPFAMLIDDLALEGGTPEAYAVLNDYVKWLNEQKIIARAFLIESEIQKEIILKRAPAFKKQNVNFFKDRESALDWLNQQFSSASI